MKPWNKSWLLLLTAVCGWTTSRLEAGYPVANQYETAGNGQQAGAMPTGYAAPPARRGLLEVMYQRFQGRGNGPSSVQAHPVTEYYYPNAAMASCPTGGPCVQQAYQVGQPLRPYASSPEPHRRPGLLTRMFQAEPQRLTPVPMAPTMMHMTMTSPASRSPGAAVPPVQEVASEVVLPQTLGQLPDASATQIEATDASGMAWSTAGPSLNTGSAAVAPTDANTILCATKSTGMVLTPMSTSVVPPVLSPMSGTQPVLSPIPGATPPTMQGVPSAAATDGHDVPPRPPVRLVNGKSIRMNYKLKDVGPSGVSTVELWYTQDGKHWQKADQSLPPMPPYTLNVKDDGLYGFTLLARNGLGLSKAAPVLGDAPQIWVEVDTAAPQVQLGDAKFGISAQVRQLMITWKVSDKNLAQHPISLAYAERAEGPWMPIASNLDNTGSYLWHLSAQLPSRYLIRVEATDLAGNVGAACSREPIVMDLSQPSVCILSVEASKKK